MRKTVLGLGRMIPIAAATFGAGLVLFGLSHVMWLSVSLMLLTGFGMMQGMAASNTIIQTVVPEDRRGRVMSYYTVAFVGRAPVGSLLAGFLAAQAGCSAHRDHHWERSHPGRNMVRNPLARDPRANPSYLPGHGHSAARGRARCGLKSPRLSVPCWCAESLRSWSRYP